VRLSPTKYILELINNALNCTLQQRFERRQLADDLKQKQVSAASQSRGYK